MKIWKMYILQSVALLITGNIFCNERVCSTISRSFTVAPLTSDFPSPASMDLNLFKPLTEQLLWEEKEYSILLCTNDYLAESAVTHKTSYEIFLLHVKANAIENNIQSPGSACKSNTSKEIIRLFISGTNKKFGKRSAYEIAPGYPAPASPHPVSIVSIKAVLKKAAVQISWEAREEFNLNLYEVERSTDGSNFQTIGLVFPWDNLDSSNSYRFADQHPQSGISFYRLKAVDKDGSVQYSAITTWGSSLSVANYISIVPNPVKGNIRAVFSGLAKGAYVVELRTVSGQLQLKKTINIQQANQLEVLERGYTAPGIYWLSIWDQQNHKLGTGRVVIQ